MEKARWFTSPGKAGVCVNFQNAEFKGESGTQVVRSVRVFVKTIAGNKKESKPNKEHVRKLLRHSRGEARESKSFLAVGGGGYGGGMEKQKNRNFSVANILGQKIMGKNLKAADLDIRGINSLQGKQGF